MEGNSLVDAYAGDGFAFIKEGVGGRDGDEVCFVTRSAVDGFTVAYFRLRRPDWAGGDAEFLLNGPNGDGTHDAIGRNAEVLLDGGNL